MLRLRHLTDADVPEYVERGRADYTRQLVEYAGFSLERAQQKTDTDWPALFPDDKIPEKAHLYAVDTEDGEHVGDLWWTERELEEGPAAFVYSIEVFAEFRGRGFGRQTMQLLEDDVRAHGLSQISLNVFGGNEVARTLYRSLGYGERAVFMSKAI